MYKKELIDLLDRLSKCIIGDWYVCDGALLGIIRDGGLIEYDDDIDIYLHPNSKINYNKLDSVGLKSQIYYGGLEKIYDPNIQSKKRLNPWSEYCSYVRHNKNAGIKMSRTELLSIASVTYHNEKIIPLFRKPNIDVFYLKKDINNLYHLKNMNHMYPFKFKNIETKIDTTLGIPIRIPVDAEDHLNKIYGCDWRINNPDFQHFK